MTPISFTVLQNMMQVNEVKSDLSQIGFDIEAIHNMVTDLVSWPRPTSLYAPAVHGYCISNQFMIYSRDDEQEGKVGLIESKQVLQNPFWNDLHSE